MCAHVSKLMWRVAQPCQVSWPFHAGCETKVVEALLFNLCRHWIFFLPGTTDAARDSGLCSCHFPLTILLSPKHHWQHGILQVIWFLSKAQRSFWTEIISIWVYTTKPLHAAEALPNPEGLQICFKPLYAYFFHFNCQSFQWQNALSNVNHFWISLCCTYWSTCFAVPRHKKLFSFWIGNSLE